MLTDRESVLAKAAIAGDQRAMSDLLKWARKLAHRHALARTGDPEDSEDIAQEVSVRVLLGLTSFEFRSRFSSWVYRITENEIRDRARRSNRLARIRHLASLQNLDLDVVPPPWTNLDWERLRDAVEVIVSDLPELQDRAFRLVAIHQFRPCEAANILGKSQTNVRASLSRARVRIQKRLIETVPALLGNLG